MLTEQKNQCKTELHQYTKQITFSDIYNKHPGFLTACRLSILKIQVITNTAQSSCMYKKQWNTAWYGTVPLLHALSTLPSDVPSFPSVALLLLSSPVLVLSVPRSPFGAVPQFHATLPRVQAAPALHAETYKQNKGLKAKAVTGNPSQSYGASSAIWDHTVLPTTRHRWMHHTLCQHSRDGRLSWPAWLSGWLYTEMVSFNLICLFISATQSTRCWTLNSFCKTM